MKKYTFLGVILGLLAIKKLYDSKGVITVGDITVRTYKPLGLDPLN
jgi:hypothetical protein